MSSNPAVEDLLFVYVHAVERDDVDAGELLAEMCRQHPAEAKGLRAGVATLIKQGLLADPGRPTPDHPPAVAGMRIERTLGGGAMGVVYLAHDEATSEPVSLKLIRRSELLVGGRDRFEREVEIARKLDHPGIAALRRAGVDQTQPYCAFDYVPGVSLEQLLQRLAACRPEQLSAADMTAPVTDASSTAPDDPASWPRRCALLVAEVADALAHAHSRGVLHRDVKPSNIMLHEDGHAVLVDFGLGTLEGAQSLTRSGTQLGSIPYMPPEQALGRRATIDERSDVYSLGVTLYELITLRPPYLGGDAASTLALVLGGRAMPPRERNSVIPRALQTICLRAMERQPRYRFDSATDFARELRKYAAGESIESRAPGLTRRTREWIARRPARATSLLFVALVVLASPLIFAWSERRTAERTRELNTELQTSLANTQRLNSQLNRALEQSRLEVARADRHYGYAREAIVKIIGKLASNSLARTPQMDRVRDEVLTAARALYTELAKERPNDQLVGSDTAFLARAHAAVLFDVGDYSRASEAAQVHEATVQRLEGLGVAKQSLLLERVLVANASSAADLKALRDEQVLVAAGRAISLSEALLATEPANARFLRLAATAHLTAARAFGGLDQGDKANAASDRAIERIDKALTIAPKEADNHFVHASVLSGCAAIALYTRLRDDVLPMARQALAAAERAAQADPGDPRYRAMRAACRLEHVGMLISQQGDAAEARAQLARCRLEYAELVVQFPEREDYWQDRSRVEVHAAQLMRAAGDAEGAMQSERQRVDVQVQRYLAKPAEDTLRRQAVVALMSGAFNAVSLFEQVPSAARECLGYCDRARELAGEDFTGQGSDHMMRSLKVLVESFAARASGRLREQGIWTRLQAMESCLPMTHTEATMATAAYLAAVDYLYGIAGEQTPDAERLAAVKQKVIEHLRVVVDSEAMSFAEIAALPGTPLMDGDAEYDALMKRFRDQR